MPLQRGVPSMATGPRSGRPERTTSLTRRTTRPAERIAMWGLRLAALLSVAVTVGIVAALLGPALAFFREVGVGEFLTGTRWAPRFADPSFGVLPS